eukprot:GFYU01009083.1.p1 GENE.GFYU01009083.1~~GFYU01009083.1.p1  ORF type:complete len:331 (+),score=113.48 GFYU01009083.1:185-1177(+)
MIHSFTKTTIALAVVAIFVVSFDTASARPANWCDNNKGKCHGGDSHTCWGYYCSTYDNIKWFGTRATNVEGIPVRIYSSSVGNIKIDIETNDQQKMQAIALGALTPLTPEVFNIDMADNGGKDQSAGILCNSWGNSGTCWAMLTAYHNPTFGNSKEMFAILEVSQGDADNKSQHSIQYKWDPFINQQKCGPYPDWARNDALFYTVYEWYSKTSDSLSYPIFKYGCAKPRVQKRTDWFKDFVVGEVVEMLKQAAGMVGEAALESFGGLLGSDAAASPQLSWYAGPELPLPAGDDAGADTLSGVASNIHVSEGTMERVETFFTNLFLRGRRG